MSVSVPSVPRPWTPPDHWLAAGVAVLSVLGSAVGAKDDIWAQPPTLSGPLIPSAAELLLLLTGSLPLALRQVAPVPVLVVCALSSLGLQSLGRPQPLPVGVLVALYTVATRCRPVLSGSAAAGYVLALLLGMVTGVAVLSDDSVFNYLVVITGSAMLGYGVALGRARAVLAEQRATELTWEQDSRTRAAVKEEQARIAREMHDIVAHDVSVIVAQAAAARRVLATEPDTALHALTSIEAVGRDALDGLRRLLGLLRADSSESERSPQPGLDRLPWLLAQVRQAGMPVELTVRGRARQLPAPVELNAYRIVQEALTNSLKHAGPTRTSVALDYRGDALDIEIRDQGPAGPLPAGRMPAGGDAGAWRAAPARFPQEAPTGYGLIGMQQRVAMLGGELTAGSEDERGFRVAAHLPVATGLL